MKKHFLMTICIALFGVISLNAQSLDQELWADVNASKKLFKNADLGLEVGFRMDNGMSSPKITYFEPDFSYEIFKNFEAAISYRYSILPGATPNSENRLGLALSYEVEVGKVDISYRTKFQQDYIPANPNEPVWRNKLKFDYNMSKKVDPFLATELFYDAGTAKEFEQFRVAIGAEIDLPKGKDVSVYYMLRNKFNVGNPGNIHVIGVSFNFGKIKKRDKGDE